ncbi:MAG: hypothetical protein ABSG22_06615 [Sedimentisphaerales bacterium]|jgi:hypothetical protein
MKYTDISKILITLFAVVLCFGPVGLADPLGTAFTYQGRLIDANKAADGLYDFQFKLYDANNAGNKLGADINKPEVNVIDGYFTVELDFNSVFDGNDRFLDIGVRPGDQNDLNVYTTLGPRQKVTATPYALHTRGISVDNDGNIYENGTKLVDKYLGKTATAANADTVDNKHAADFVSSSLVGSSWVYEGSSTQDTLMAMTTAGWTVKTDGDTDCDHTLVLATTSAIIEYTLWYGGTVSQGEASLGHPATITFPHYQGFLLILARPANGYIASLTCRENDCYVVCVYHKSHP